MDSMSKIRAITRMDALMYLILSGVILVSTVGVLYLAPAATLNWQTFLLSFINQSWITAIGVLILRAAPPTHAVRRRFWMPLILAVLISYLFMFYYASNSTIGDYMPLDIYGHLMSGYMAHDTGFHVILIQSIMDTGIPSLHLHESPVTGYHVATHYYDALIYSILGLDVFEFYGHMQFTKVGPTLTAVSLVCLWIARNRGVWAFAGLYLLSCLLMLPTWHIVLSHGLWMPVVVSLLAWPWTLRLIEKPVHLAEGFVFIALCALLTFGKVSHGLAFAAFAGLVLYLRNYWDWRVYLIGSGTVLMFLLYFFLWVTASPDSLGSGDLNLGAMPFQAHIGLLGLIGLGYVLTRSDLRSRWSMPASCLIVLCLFSVLLPAAITSHQGHLGYFGMSLFFISWLAFATIWFQEPEESLRVRGQASRFIRWIGWAVLVLAVQDLGGQNSKLHRFPERVQELSSFLEKRELDAGSQSFVEALKHYRKNNTLGYANEVHLFLSKDRWESLSRRFIVPKRADWNGALFAQSILRRKQIYGVPVGTTHYGLSDYGLEGRWGEGVLDEDQGVQIWKRGASIDSLNSPIQP